MAANATPNKLPPRMLITVLATRKVSGEVVKASNRITSGRASHAKTNAHTDCPLNSNPSSENQRDANTAPAAAVKSVPGEKR